MAVLYTSFFFFLYRCLASLSLSFCCFITCVALVSITCAVGRLLVLRLPPLSRVFSAPLLSYFPLDLSVPVPSRTVHRARRLPGGAARGSARIFFLDPFWNLV